MKRVTLFALSTCAICSQVKKFLADHAIPYTLIEVDTLDSGEQWLMTKELAKHNPQRTYPTVVVEEVIRGCDIDALSSRLLEENPEKS
ncbi:MAG TPA: glutaredoxin family protein [Nitrospiraceae bacterium]|nr:glutaredoxin family protein [Nitrospiraceae bacterium]